VGPNEAGKSTILEAMLSLDEDEPFTDRERTRESGGPTRVEAGYVLDDADRDALADIHGGSKVRWWTLE
jgi:ABC-type Mn2+/Zn2+ transport system ATPase subunit